MQEEADAIHKEYDRIKDKQKGLIGKKGNYNKEKEIMAMAAELSDRCLVALQKLHHNRESLMYKSIDNVKYGCDLIKMDPYKLK